MYLINNIRTANIKKFIRNLKKISKKKNISIIKLYFDFLICLIKYRFTFNDYLNYEIYLKTDIERKEYVSCKEQDEFYKIVSPEEFKKVFTIKPNFLKVFNKYTKRDYLVIENNYDDFIKYINKKEVFFIKPQDGLGGAGVRRVVTKDIKDPYLLYQELETNKLFIEDEVIQHPLMNKLAPNSVNTIRVMTSNINNNPKILITIIRIGNGINHVDNFHSGGMGCLVDKDTGKILTGATDKDLNYYKKHPVTKVNFKGFQLPHWDKVIKMVLEASKVEPRIKVIGWDVAICKDGPVLIEGNRRPGFDLVQVVYKRGRKDIIKDINNEINSH